MKKLFTITHEIDKIHNSYKRLKYQKLMPCNCYRCKNSQSPYFYTLERLHKFIVDKQEKIQCQESYEMVSVLGLIDDIDSYLAATLEASVEKNLLIQGDYIQGNKGDIITQSVSFGVSVNKGIINSQNIARNINPSRDEII